MNRIIFVTILSCVLLSMALLAQNPQEDFLSPVKVQAAGASRTEARPVQTRAEGAVVASISGDGRFFAFADWSTPGDLAVQDLMTGEYRRLTHTGSYSAQASSISPDGTQIAYQWRNDDRVYDLRLIGIDGSDPRVLLVNKDANIYPSDWSPDGKQVLTVLARNDGSHQIALISVADGAARIVKHGDSRFPQTARFSPDGRYVVYDITERTDRPARDIVLLSADGRHEIALVRGVTDDAVLGWALDGTRVLFARTRAGTMDAWAVPVVEGRPQGPPVLVKRDMGQIRSLGFSRDGALYYVRDRGTREVYLASLDPSTGSLVSPPRRVRNGSEDPTFGPTWSPDGERLAYFSTRGANDIGPGARTIVIRSLKSGEERVLTPMLDYPIDHPYELRWSPDSRSLVTIGNDKQGRWSVYLVNAETGTASMLVQGRSGERIRWPAWSADRRVLFYVNEDPATQLSRVLTRDLRSGRVKEIYRAPLSALSFNRGNSMVLSPDGRYLAFSQSGVVMILPTAGGDARALPAARGGVMAWMSNDRVLFRANGVWSIALDGTGPKPVGPADGLFGLSVHPNGREIAFTAGVIAQGEVWVMEHFLTPLKTAR